MSGKKRNIKFSENEKMLLVDIVEQERHIVENKKTDAATLKIKETCWQKISAEFNSRSPDVFRSSIALRICWENMKKRTRRHFAAVSQEHFPTGVNNVSIIEDPVAEKVRSIIKIPVVKENTETRNASTSTNTNCSLKRRGQLAKCKKELIELIKDDMKAKRDIEVEILKVRLEREKVQLEIAKTELQMKNAALRSTLPS